MSGLSPIGLCAACRHVQVVKSAKGSFFVLCGLAKSNPQFNKYPLLPVFHCTGFEQLEQQVDSQSKESS